jgi:uncharacterized protein YutE (UPF0331/DUF86 family)
LVDANIVADRIHRIRECVGFLKKIGEITTEESFLKDPFLTGSAERYLQVALQAVLDISNHIVADFGFEAPSEYRQVPEILAKRKLIPKPLALRLSRMMGMRNILVHEYLKLDLRLVYHVIQKDLDDFARFIKAIEKFL